MHTLTRSAAGLVLAWTTFALATEVSAQQRQEPPQTPSQQQACSATVTPNSIPAGQRAVRMTVALSQNAGAVKSIDGASSGITVAQAADLPRTELASGASAPQPIAMGTGQNTWTIWVNTSSARPGSHRLTFVANGPCTGEVTVAGAVR